MSVNVIQAILMFNAMIQQEYIVYPFSGSDCYPVLYWGKCVLILHFITVIQQKFSETGYRKVEIFMCDDDIWDDRFDNISDCVECFNQIIFGSLYLLLGKYFTKL